MQRIRIESLGVSKPAKGFLAKDKGSLDHAVIAGKKALESSGRGAHEIDLLINTGIYRDHHYAEPAFACFIQNALGINPEFQGRQTLSFDLNNGSCGVFNGIDVAQNLMRAGRSEVAMVIASEANADKNADASWNYSPSGAALILDISPNNTTGFGQILFERFPQYDDLYSSVVSLAEKHGKLLIRKKEEDLESAYLESLGSVWQKLLDQESMSATEIDCLCATQISEKFLHQLATLTKVDSSKIINLRNDSKDTLTTGPFLAFETAKQSGTIQKGSNIVFLGFGSGLTLSAARYIL